MQAKQRSSKMKSVRFFLMILMTGVLFLSACASQSDLPAPSATPPPADSLTVTLDDQGRTITLPVGDSFLLKLGEEYNWDISISDQAVLSRVMGIAVIRGAQGIYEAHQPGTVTLSATGDPQCRQSQPACELPSLQFSVTIVVK
jgi:hypothetical protein